MAYNQYAQEMTEDPLVKNYGQTSITSSTPTTIAVMGTYYKILGTTVDTATYNFHSSGDNRLICDDLVSKMYLVSINISASIALLTAVCGFTIAKNGTAITSSSILNTVGTATSLGNVSLQILVDLIKDDYIEVYISNTTGTDSITVTNMNLVITQI